MGEVLEQILKIISRIQDPVQVAAVALIVGLSAFVYAIKAKKRINQWILGILATGIIILGLAALASHTFLKSITMYHVRVIVLAPDRTLVKDADLTSSSGDQPKKFDGGWEFDIAPQTRPADGKVVLRASVRNAFLTGSSTVVLDKDYYPTITIQLTTDTSAVIRGVVEDERRRPVTGANVSIIGYDDGVSTGNTGNFVLPAHAANGQIVQIRAQKGQLVASLSVPAGSNPVEIMLRRP